MSVWVVNTPPLVFLGNLRRLELLRQEGQEVYIPRAVAREVAEKPDAAADVPPAPGAPTLESVQLVPYDRAWATNNKARLLKKWQAIIS